MSGGGLMIGCRVCRRERDVEDMQQFVPCLHIFCKDCVKEYSNRLKDGTSADGQSKQTQAV
ncbi:hypothetical protein Tcan_17095 [Toxocara canis]|uniref:RING-type domain-containing protein n=1 Tax=Toxocara canis TaxID=6265 RepID=A0A0B2V9H1_TOXCA|nr:hypothetical protein Tcan_17095 [Toxocara canis]